MINVLNYASYARAINQGMRPGKNRTRIGQQLTDFITEKPYIKNREGNQFNITSRETSAWWNYGDLPEGITEAAIDLRIIKEAPDYFENKIIGELLSPGVAQKAYDAVADLVRTDNMAGDLKVHLLDMYSRKEWAKFLAETFLYALQRPNKELVEEKDESVPLTDAVDALVEVLSKLPRPVQIKPKDEIGEDEMVYVTAILAAYANAENLEGLNREDLKKPQYRKYNQHFIRQRNDYYSAVSVERSARDDMRLNEMHAFDDFRNDVYSNVVDVAEGHYENYFERMKAVLIQAGGMGPTSSILDRIPGWIGPQQRKGVCHILVNEHELWWTDEQAI